MNFCKSVTKANNPRDLIRAECDQKFFEILDAMFERNGAVLSRTRSADDAVLDHEKREALDRYLTHCAAVRCVPYVCHIMRADLNASLLAPPH